jgi:hypothetical protein
MLLKEQTLLIQSIDPESLLKSFIELKQEIREIKSFIESKLDLIHSQTSVLLTREEVAKLFKINISTVRNWSKSGVLLPYYCGDRVYFKQEEVLKALIPSNFNIQKK